MSFIQCRSTEEIEKTLKTMNLPYAFITEDHRIYTEMELSDDAVFYDLDARTVGCLIELQSHMEWMTEGFMETDMLELEEIAKDFSKKVRETFAALKFKPRPKKEKK